MYCTCGCLVQLLILGSNVIKHLIRTSRSSLDFWKNASASHQSPDEGRELLQSLATVEIWRGDEVPDRVGTVKLKRAVTLEPMKEHFV